MRDYKRRYARPVRYLRCWDKKGQLRNRTYRVGAKQLQTAPTGLELSGSKPHLPSGIKLIWYKPITARDMTDREKRNFRRHQK